MAVNKEEDGRAAPLPASHSKFHRTLSCSREIRHRDHLRCPEVKFMAIASFVKAVLTEQPFSL